MKTILIMIAMMLGIFLSSCTETVHEPNDVEIGQIWVRVDSADVENIVEETLIILYIKDDYAAVDYNGWWVSVRRLSLIQNIYTYESTLTAEELVNVVRTLPDFDEAEERFLESL